MAGWSDDLLSTELLAILDDDPDYDLAVTGFEGGALEALLEATQPKNSNEDSVPEARSDAAPVTRPGDIWLLGTHKLICGDSRDIATFRSLMGDEVAQMVITDPPYNVPVNGHVCGLGGVKHPEFAMASGEMTQHEFQDFLHAVFLNLARASADGSIHYICMDWRHMGDLLESARSVYAELKNLIVWNKDNGGMGAFYRSKHELIFAFKNGKAPHINNFELGQHGRYRTNVWDYAGVNSLKAERADELAMHPTVKPVAMIADAIRDCSKRGGVILDAFSGSGTTIIAAEQTGRRARAIEFEPHYVDVAVRRWQTITGCEATLEGSTMTFAEVENVLS